MKVSIFVEQEIEVRFVEVILPVRYDDEDIPYDFPLRDGDSWKGVINIDTGVIEGWPIGKSGEMHMKVVDGGVYILLDENKKEVKRIEDNYVPNDLIPGSYGDYVEFKINENGKIINWPEDPKLGEFFEEED